MYFENSIELFWRLILRLERRDKSYMIFMMRERLFLSALTKIRVSSTKLRKGIVEPLPIRFLSFCDSKCSFLAKDSIAMIKMYGDRGQPWRIHLVGLNCFPSKLFTRTE